MMLPTLPFDPYTVRLTIGLLYTIMPLTVWTVLRGRHDMLSTSLWCGGAWLSGVSLVLIGLRESIPLVLSLEIANTVGYVGYAIRWVALRRERGVPVRMVTAALAALLAGGCYAYAVELGVQQRLLFNLAVLALACLMTAREARLLALEKASRSARMIALTCLMLAAALLLRLLAVITGVGVPMATRFGLDSAVVVVAGMLSALWGNIGYLGVAMEAAQGRESARRAELAAATARSEQAERQAAALQALSDERHELLHVISHEVRQPLHNAQAVLQGVDRELHTELLAGGEAAAARVARARSVLRQITASLDNTLAASTLLVDSRPTSLRETEIDMLLELSLGDLPPDGRARIRVEPQADLRSAAMDVGLMRLALRNLLNNALAYAVPGSTVSLRVLDSDEPLALLVEVADGGPPIAPDLLPHIFERGTRGRHDLPGQGLGLYIVRLAMQRQGGSVTVDAGVHGNMFTLLLPQGLEPA